MTTPSWPCLLLSSTWYDMSPTLGQRRAKWNIVWILFFYYLGLSNTFKDFPAHYLASFFICTNVVPRENMAWSGDRRVQSLRVTGSSWGHTLPNSLPLCWWPQTLQNLPYFSLGSAHTRMNRRARLRSASSKMRPRCEWACLKRCGQRFLVHWAFHFAHGYHVHYSHMSHFSCFKIAF